ncbi:hypothetical protein GY45DRAFT_296621 [Cubamyces sp. BRFM 1775]|nr:hypothetical protein GY45DRAFT_296621 [Cubamyces sp. BRFM 1775]
MPRALRLRGPIHLRLGSASAGLSSERALRGPSTHRSPLQYTSGTIAGSSLSLRSAGTCPSTDLSFDLSLSSSPSSSSVSLRRCSPVFSASTSRRPLLASPSITHAEAPSPSPRPPNSPPAAQELRHRPLWLLLLSPRVCACASAQQTRPRTRDVRPVLRIAPEPADARGVSVCAPSPLAFPARPDEGAAPFRRVRLAPARTRGVHAPPCLPRVCRAASDPFSAPPLSVRRWRYQPRMDDWGHARSHHLPSDLSRCRLCCVVRDPRSSRGQFLWPLISCPSRLLTFRRHPRALRRCASG